MKQTQKWVETKLLRHVPRYTCQHKSGTCQSHFHLVQSLRKASRNYTELSRSTPPFLTLCFPEKDLTSTLRLLQVWPILPLLRHILSHHHPCCCLLLSLVPLLFWLDLLRWLLVQSNPIAYKASQCGFVPGNTSDTSYGILPNCFLLASLDKKSYAKVHYLLCLCWSDWASFDKTSVYQHYYRKLHLIWHDARQVGSCPSVPC
jgi:hypothetical protein